MLRTFTLNRLSGFIRVYQQTQGLSDYGAKSPTFIHSEKNNAFCLNLPQGTATVEYKRENQILHLEHTVVPDVYKGKGVGNQIAREVLEYCVNNNIRVRVSCGFLSRFIQKNPQYCSIVVSEKK